MTVEPRGSRSAGPGRRRWQHSVYADDSSFTSGAPDSTGTFQRTFTTPGTFGYYCQVHGSLTGGMRGTVIVTAPSGGGGDGGGSGPGTIGFSPTSLTVTEADGVASVTVARTGGSDGKATVKFATAPGSAKAGKDFTPRAGLLSWAAGDGDPKTIEIPIKKDNVAGAGQELRRPAQQGHRRRARRRRRRSSPSTTALRAAASTVAGDPAKLHAVGTVDGSTARLRRPQRPLPRRRPLRGDRAVAPVDRRRRPPVQACPAAGDAELGPLHLLLAGGAAAPAPVLDRCSVNGHYWLSLAAATDVEFTVRVRDTQTGRTRVYLNPAGSTPAVLRDVEAFGACQ